MQTQYYDYSLDPEIPNRVVKEIDSYINYYGRDPEQLILGYGTYFSLVVTISNYRMSPNLIWITDFEGIPIVVDQGYEYRVSVSRKCPKESAVEAFMRKQKTNG